MGNVEHLFLQDNNFVLTVAAGEISDEKFLKHIAIVNQSSKLRANYRGIVDCRKVSPIRTPSSEAIFKAGHFGGENAKPRKVAVLADNDLIYGLVRMYDAYTCCAEMEVCADLDAAAKWLGINSLYAEVKDFYRHLDLTESYQAEINCL